MVDVVSAENPIDPTPTELGFRMPAEWEPHSATWLSWPRPEGISFPGSYARILPVFAEIVAALAGSETVCINVSDSSMEATVRKHLARVPTDHVEFHHNPTNEPWCRDHGPIFIVRDGSEPTLAVTDWGYNAWGEKYPPYDLDNAIPQRIATTLGVDVFRGGMVLEGGSIDVNGSGTLLTTESCLLNPNRNPHLSRQDIEQRISGFLGVSQVLWLGDGIEGDDTDGHIDDITRFVAEDLVVTAVEDDTSDPNSTTLRANVERLECMSTAAGSPLRIRKLPMPPRLMREGRRLPASYANFYIGNTVVLLPVFGSDRDAHAVDLLQECFPTRRIAAIDCRELIWGLGAFHCLTQQQPAIS